MKVWIGLIKLLYIVSITVITSYGIGWLTTSDNLIIGAVPLGLFLIASFAWLDSKWQTGAWAGAGFWLLSLVYMSTNNPIEYIALAIVTGLTVLGLFKSPYYLVGLWFFHPLWDLIPRDLPNHMHDLPLACLIYDTVIALYLLWAVRKRRLVAIGSESENPNWNEATRNIGYALFVILIVTIQVGTIYLGLSSEKLTLLAAPIGLIIIALLYWLPTKVHHIALALLTAWMGMTFAHSGHLLEIAIFFVIILLSYLGVVRNSRYFMLAWGFHAIWSFAPVPWHMMHHFGMGHMTISTASGIYDFVILAYLIFALLYSKKHRQDVLIGPKT